MDTANIILQVAVILVAARAMGELATRLGVPSVIGEIVAGVILGPSLLGFVEPEGLIWVLAEIGIILLLFEVGLETDIGELASSGTKSVIVAISGFILPFGSCFALSYYWFELESTGGAADRGDHDRDQHRYHDANPDRSRQGSEQRGTHNPRCRGAGRYHGCAVTCDPVQFHHQRIGRSGRRRQDPVIHDGFLPGRARAGKDDQFRHPSVGGYQRESRHGSYHHCFAGVIPGLVIARHRNSLSYSGDSPPASRYREDSFFPSEPRSKRTRIFRSTCTSR